MTNVLDKDDIEHITMMALRGEGAWNGQKWAWEDVNKTCLLKTY